MNAAEPILVVGAGIAGLVAALSLAKAGYRADICERAPSLDEAGAGIQLSPNALRVLDRLGLSDALQRQGVAADAVTLRRFRTGRPIATVPVRASDGTRYLSIHRADLQAALLAEVARETRISLSLGLTCIALETQGGRTEVAFAAAGGTSSVTRSARIVVAADGARSAVAACLGQPGASASGDIAFRMTVDGPHPAAAAGIEAWLGPRRHAVAYPLRGGAETNLVLITGEPGGRRNRASDASTTTASADKARILAEFESWDTRLLSLVEAAGPATAWPLFTTDRRPRAQHPEGIVLLGDAAHAMLPYAAQGAAMAIEDGWTLAWALKQAPTIREAFARYETARRSRLEQVHRRVAFHRFVYHLPPPLSLGRDLVLASRPAASLARDLEWLYDWQPPETACSADE